jgi:hypothetical protein
LEGEYSGPFLKNPKDVYVQFQYLFVTDDDGLKVLNIEDPLKPVPVSGGVVHLRHPHKLYVARDYVFVADGEDGLAFIDIEKPEQPRLTQLFNANGLINDARAVQIGSISASMYALVADGRNGFRVIQLISPDTVPEAEGFDPKPSPRLIATYPIKEGEALAISRGLDRDRVQDETCNQTVVFGRRGSGPLYQSEIDKLLKHSDGSFYRVNDVEVDGKGGVQFKGGDSLTDPLPLNMPAPTDQPADVQVTDEQLRIPQRPE